MKKILYLTAIAITLICSNKSFAQGSVSITGPSTVEVGYPYQYTFTFNPCFDCVKSSDGTPANGFVITAWKIWTQTTIYGKNIKGYIGDALNNSNFYTDFTTNYSNIYVLPIQWGDDIPLRAEIISVQIEGYYTTNNAMSLSFTLTNNKNVTVERMSPPIITKSSVLDCDETVTNYAISNTTYANQYQWNATNGAQIIGSGTGSSANIKPPISGNFDVSCTIKRSGGNPNYSVSSTKNISRTPRVVNFTTSPLSQYVICKSTGLIFQIQNQPDIQSVIWNAPNCTISNETIVNGIRQVKITPKDLITDGSSISVNADVTFSGGCISKTNTKNYVVGVPKNEIITATFSGTQSNYKNLLIEESDNIIFENHHIVFSVPQNLNSSYQWKINGNVIPNSIGPNLTINAMLCDNYNPSWKIYKAEVLMTNSCGTTVSCREFKFYCNPYPYLETLGSCLQSPAPTPPIEVEINAPNEDFLVSPNPSNDFITISHQLIGKTREQSVNLNKKLGYTTKIYVEKGLILQETQSRAGEDTTLDVSKIATGTYFLHIQQGDKIIKKQIIIKH